MSTSQEHIDPRLNQPSPHHSPYYPSPSSSKPSSQYSPPPPSLLRRSESLQRPELPPLAPQLHHAQQPVTPSQTQEQWRLPPPQPYHQHHGGSPYSLEQIPRAQTALPDRGRVHYESDPAAYQNHSGGGGFPIDPNDPKRSRACESCRQLKVRCEPQDPNDMSKPCKRCAKANRQCIVTAPSRKRHKKVDKTEDNIAELHNQIAHLSRQVEILKHDRPRAFAENEITQSSPTVDSVTPDSSSQSTPYNGQRRDGPTSTPVVGTKRSASAGHEDDRRVRRTSPDSHPDVDDAEAEFDPIGAIDGQIEDILDRDTATEIFDYYCKQMACHMPAVRFDQDTTADQVRSAKPVLFLSILVCASVGIIDIDSQDRLAKACMGVLADLIIRIGEKSLELIQALLLQVLWYRSPKRYEQMNFYQLSHMAAVMAIDVGMGKKKATVAWRMAAANVPGQFMKSILNPDSLEVRRAWLGCHFQCSNVSMSLRRPTLLRWTSYMDECIDMLENSQDASKSDMWLTWHAKVQHINEDIGIAFSMDDPSANITIADKGVQQEMAKFEKQLEIWRDEVPNEAWNTTLEFAGHVADLYAHELALHIGHNIDDFRAPFTEESIRASSGHVKILSPTHLGALKKCLSAVHNILKIFFGFTMVELKALPIFYFIRVAYAVVVLIKFHFAVSQSEELATQFPLRSMHLEENLSKMLDLFQKLNSQGAFRPASKFLIIIGKLHEYFQKNKNTAEASATARSSTLNLLRPTFGAEQTNSNDQGKWNKYSAKPAGDGSEQRSPPHRNALDLLSDVATKEEASRAGMQHQHRSPYYPIGQVSDDIEGHLQHGRQPDTYYHPAAPGWNHSIHSAGMQGSIPGHVGDSGGFQSQDFDQIMDITFGFMNPDFSSFVINPEVCFDLTAPNSGGDSGAVSGPGPGPTIGRSAGPTSDTSQWASQQRPW